MIRTAWLRGYLDLAKMENIIKKILIMHNEGHKWHKYDVQRTASL
jgi:hypothetical protein